jgi:mannitol/fructose-specific phosphotransferase system IIA component (Ntr-type)
MKISELIRPENVFPALSAATKEDAIRQLVATIGPEVGPGCAETALNAVLERESVMSTGVGKGLAIPHGRVPGISRNFVAFARLENPIEYGSIDQKPVNLIFLLIGPETQSSLHIKLLSRISRLMNNDAFRNALQTCASAEDIVTLFQNEESHFI